MECMLQFCLLYGMYASFVCSMEYMLQFCLLYGMYATVLSALWNVCCSFVCSMGYLLHFVCSMDYVLQFCLLYGLCASVLSALWMEYMPQFCLFYRRNMCHSFVCSMDGINATVLSAFWDICQFCLLYEPFRKEIWPGHTPVACKLCGRLEDLQHTNTSIAMTEFAPSKQEGKIGKEIITIEKLYVCDKKNLWFREKPETPMYSDDCNNWT